MFAFICAMMIAAIFWGGYRFDVFVIGISESFKKRDEQLFNLNTRLQTLEEQRDIERRVTALEKAARTFCVGTKTEMCGTLEVVK